MSSTSAGLRGNLVYRDKAAALMVAAATLAAACHPAFAQPAPPQSPLPNRTPAMSCADRSCMTDEELLRRIIIVCEASETNRPGTNQARFAHCIWDLIVASKQKGVGFTN